MRTIPIVNGLCILLFLLLFDDVENNSFIWNLKSKPLIFGKDAQLTCHGRACQPNTIKKWIGGPSYKLLCYVGYSVDFSKYEIMINDTTADFGLMIKNITIEDTYCRYTCACGINHYTETLDLKGVDYVYPPDIHSNITVEKGGNCQIDIQLDVYPYPTCVLTYETIVLPVNITITSTKYNLKGGNLQMYNVHIMHTLDVHNYSCKGKIILTCNVGNQNYTDIQKGIDFCKEKVDTNFLIPLIVIVCVATVFIAFVIIILTTKYMIKKDKIIQYHNPEDLKNSEL